MNIDLLRGQAQGLKVGPQCVSVVSLNVRTYHSHETYIKFSSSLSFKFLAV